MDIMDSLTHATQTEITQNDQFEKAILEGNDSAIGKTKPTPCTAEQDQSCSDTDAKSDPSPRAANYANATSPFSGVPPMNGRWSAVV